MHLEEEEEEGARCEKLISPSSVSEQKQSELGVTEFNIYPHHLQLGVQSVQLHEVFFVGDWTSGFQPPVVELPVLHPGGHTCSPQRSVTRLGGGSTVIGLPVSGLGLTVDGELAVGVEDQLLDVLLFGLFQRSAGRLVQNTTHTKDAVDIFPFKIYRNSTNFFLLLLQKYIYYLRVRNFTGLQAYFKLLTSLSSGQRSEISK